MEVFTANFKEVRVIGDQIGDDAGTTQRNGDGFFPYFNGAPRFPQEIPCSNQDVVAGGNTRQRTSVMVGELE